MKKLKSLLICFAAVLAFCLMLMPVAADGTQAVADEYGLLSDYQQEQLADYAERVSKAHNTGVYIRIIDSYAPYGNNIEQASEMIYKSENLGVGTEKNGILMLIAMDGRWIDLCAYGNTANTAFTDYAKDQMREDYIVPYLSDGDWYGGCSEFISQADKMLTFYESNGVPFDTNTDPAYLAQQQQAEQAARSAKVGATLGFPPLIALLTCLGLKSKNKTSGIKHEANQYFARNGIQFPVVQDMFINRTQTRAPLPHNDNHGPSGPGGGTTINAGGFSHSSGHF